MSSKSTNHAANGSVEGPTDLQLIRRLVDGDGDALGLLYDRYAATVTGLARSILRDQRLAEEAAHDVFLNLWQNPQAYDPSRGPFAGWLFRVARNRAIDLFRRRREQPFGATAVNDDGEALDPASFLVDGDPDPADQAVTTIQREAVRAGLRQLSADHQRLLELAYFRGMTQSEIAAQLNRPLGTVKTQIRSAMRKLADVMSETSTDEGTSRITGDGCWLGAPCRISSLRRTARSFITGMSSTYSSELNCNEVVDSLGAYALDALDSDEREVIDAHLAVCPACSVALAEFTRTADALAFAVAPIQPSPELRVRVMTSAGLSRVRESAPEPVSIAAAREAKAKRRAPAWLLPVVSAAAAVLLVAVGILGVALAKMVDQRDDAATTAQMLSTYVSAGGNVVTLQAQPVSLYSSYDGKGSLLTAPGKDPVVVVAGCPKSGDYLTYWVWFSKDGKRVAAGKLTVGGDGSGWIALDDNLSLADFDTIGITIKVQDDKSEDVLIAPLSDSSVSQLQQG